MSADTYSDRDWDVAGRAWTALFAAIDAGDAPGFASFLTPTATFVFGNAPPITGRAAIIAAVAGFFASIDGSRHELAAVYAGDGRVACEGTVTYTRRDRRVVAVPFADTFRLEDGAIAEYRVYIDLAPLQAG